DLDELYRLYSDPDIRHYFPDGTRTLDETKEELEWFLNGHPRHPDLGLWATVRKDTGQLIGRCGLLPWVIDGTLEIEVAYMIAKEHWRHGFGSEAATAIVQYGLQNLGLKRIIALIDAEHEASIKTAEKAGLRFDKEVVMDGLASSVYAIERPTDLG
ncbi:MAG: hypothetical protein QOJ65_1170, partial [Fimbriimonadaceae bacterium]|nr:hypothetical protein [Fimbriimonadaceae bacterium]